MLRLLESVGALKGLLRGADLMVNFMGQLDIGHGDQISGQMSS